MLPPQVALRRKRLLPTLLMAGWCQQQQAAATTTAAAWTGAGQAHLRALSSTKATQSACLSISLQRCCQYTKKYVYRAVREPFSSRFRAVFEPHRQLTSKLPGLRQGQCVAALFHQGLIGPVCFMCELCMGPHHPQTQDSGEAYPEGTVRIKWVCAYNYVLCLPARAV